MEENNVVMNEETIETVVDDSAEEENPAAGILLLVSLGAAGTVAVQQLYRRVLKPFGKVMKAKWDNRQKSKAKHEKTSDEDDDTVVQEENAE